MTTFSRELKVGKTDAFEIDVSTWADSEAITSVGVTDATGLVTVGATQIVGTLLTVLCTGVSIGLAELHFQYTTVTRSDCVKINLAVIADC